MLELALSSHHEELPLLAFAPMRFSRTNSNNTHTYMHTQTQINTDIHTHTHRNTSTAYLERCCYQGRRTHRVKKTVKTNRHQWVCLMYSIQCVYELYCVCLCVYEVCVCVCVCVCMTYRKKKDTQTFFACLPSLISFSKTAFIVSLVYPKNFSAASLSRAKIIIGFPPGGFIAFTTSAGRSLLWFLKYKRDTSNANGS